MALGPYSHAKQLYVGLTTVLAQNPFARISIDVQVEAINIPWRVADGSPRASCSSMDPVTSFLNTGASAATWFGKVIHLFPVILNTPNPQIINNPHMRESMYCGDIIVRGWARLVLGGGRDAKRFRSAKATSRLKPSMFIEPRGQVSAMTISLEVQGTYNPITALLMGQSWPTAFYPGSL